MGARLMVRSRKRALGLLTAVLVGASTLVAATPLATPALASPTGNIELFAGGVGEGLGTDIGQIPQHVAMTDQAVFSSGGHRAIVTDRDIDLRE